MKTKICGMKYPENIREIAQLQPDLMGFIFYNKSPRYVGEDFSKKILEELPSNIKKVGIFVNEPIKSIISIQEKYNFDFLQLHGTETPTYCQTLQSKNYAIIKAFGIKTGFNFSSLVAYEAFCDFFLFDTHYSDFGGSGKVFDWEILRNYSLKTAFFLSGGLSEENLEKISQISSDKIYALDFNSKLESEIALKNIHKTKSIIKKVQKL
ncbi:MAG: phosphoribosylanthranilate isomerase [Thermonemataceae bacterium]|nr:phosphoribosylanthranilate isomerase [Thermonemataceae bacterium]